MSDATGAHAVPGYSRVTHGLAIILTIAVFPLIWVGGLVTTYDAGMAVPDWPSTYGWNMFAYPASTWLFGPFDLLVEHSHRLLGTVAGLLSIGLVAAAFLWDCRAWFRRWTLLILAAVILQGALGGARVLLDQRTIAMIHGCTGPLFFALAAATAVMSSRWWFRQREDCQPVSGDGDLRQIVAGKPTAWLASAAVLLSYVQLVAGAQLRHVTGIVSPKMFKGLVHTHLGLASLVLLVVVLLSGVALLNRRFPAKIRWTAQLLALMVFGQIALGIGTWIVNYALPWSELNDTLANFTISAKGFWESLIVTAHMAMGSLIISTATVLSVRSWRTRYCGRQAV